MKIAICEFLAFWDNIPKVECIYFDTSNHNIKFVYSDIFTELDKNKFDKYYIIFNGLRLLSGELAFIAHNKALHYRNSELEIDKVAYKQFDLHFRKWATMKVCRLKDLQNKLNILDYQTVKKVQKTSSIFDLMMKDWKTPDRKYRLSYMLSALCVIFEEQELKQLLTIPKHLDKHLYLIYAVIEKLTGKFYIGQHKLMSLNEYLGSGKVWKDILKLIDKENILKVQLLVVTGKLKADKRLIFHINRHIKDMKCMNLIKSQLLF